MSKAKDIAANQAQVAAHPEYKAPTSGDWFLIAVVVLFLGAWLFH